jgi:hypothetical protein
LGDEIFSSLRVKADLAKDDEAALRAKERAEMGFENAFVRRIGDARP